MKLRRTLSRRKAKKKDYQEAHEVQGFLTRRKPNSNHVVLPRWIVYRDESLN